MVDRGEGGNVTDELVKQGWLKKVSFLGDKWLFSEHNVLRRSRICGEKSPVDEASVPRTQMIELLLNLSVIFT